MLKDDADAGADAVGIHPRIGDVVPLKEDLTVVDALEQVDGLEQRRLAGAARPDEHDHLVFGDVDVDALQHRGLAEPLLHAVDPQNGSLLGHT